MQKTSRTRIHQPNNMQQQAPSHMPGKKRQNNTLLAIQLQTNLNRQIRSTPQWDSHYLSSN
jgi:hypothetical protein